MSSSAKLQPSGAARLTGSPPTRSRALHPMAALDRIAGGRGFQPSRGRSPEEPVENTLFKGNLESTKARRAHGPLTWMVQAFKQWTGSSDVPAAFAIFQRTSRSLRGNGRNASSMSSAGRTCPAVDILRRWKLIEPARRVGWSARCARNPASDTNPYRGLPASSPASTRADPGPARRADPVRGQPSRCSSRRCRSDE